MISDNPAPSLDLTAKIPPYLRNVSIDDLKFEEIRNEKQSITSLPKIDPITKEEVFELIRNLKDPEHPQFSLEQLRIVRMNLVSVRYENKIPEIKLLFVPTIPTCSVATVIGLTLKLKITLCLAEAKVEVIVKDGTHNNSVSINKQLADKERVAAAAENKNLKKMVHRANHDADKIPRNLELVF
jgi:metal-sulfur cluster biosynthetic enzyme